MFTAEAGTLLLASSPVGFLAVLGDPDANDLRLRPALRDASEGIRRAWERGGPVQ
jgi:hypothetical protein